MSEENKTPQAATPPQGQVSAELTVQDLSVLKTIIEVAQSRGAFKANELSSRQNFQQVRNIFNYCIKPTSW